MESTMVVSAVLQDFYEGETDLKVLADSCKVLSKLISNASQPSAELRYRCVRLENTRIQSAVVAVRGALDILGLAGFQKSKDDPNVLVYSASDTSSREVCLVLVQNLEEKLCEFEKLGVLVAAGFNNKATTTVDSTAGDRQNNEDIDDNNNNNNNNKSKNPFLSEEERQRRREAAKAAKKAREAERSRALSRWKEDDEDRKIKAMRKETAQTGNIRLEIKDAERDRNIRAALLAPVIRIKRMEKQEAATVAATSTNPMPMESSEQPRKVALSKMEQEHEGSTKILPVSEVTSVPMETDTEESSTMAAADDDNSAARLWKKYLETTPRCASATGIRNTSYFVDHFNQGTSSSPSGPSPLRHLLKELDSMNESLPSDGRCSIFVRFDEESPQYLRAVIPAALPGPTPYAGGLFVFDIFVPNDYPQVPPKVQLLTTGGGTVRFGPNLYANGKVCLSLLGTWDGPPWQTGISSINQVLISIQGLILGAEHPYYLEPGHGGWEGHIKEGAFAKTGHTLAGGTIREDVVPTHVAVYEDNLRVATLKFAMLDNLRALKTNKESFSPPSTMAKFLQPFFVRSIHLHFHHNRDRILQEMESWNRGRALAHHKIMDNIIEDFGHQKESLDSLLKQIERLHGTLRKELESLPEPPVEDPYFWGDQKPAAVNVGAVAVKPAMAPVNGDQKMPALLALKKPSDLLDDMRGNMQAAARSGNFILAGKLQENIKAVEDLQTSMQNAASKGDFIRAGRLQEQLNARVENLNLIAATASPSQPAAAAAASPAVYQDDGAYFQEDYDDDVGKDEEEEGGFDGQDDGFNSGFAMPSSQWQDPESHTWGPGSKLKASSVSLCDGVLETPSARALQLSRYKSKRSSGSSCLLRIRLPGAPPITEQFDAEDTLRDVYYHLEQYVHKGFSSSRKGPPAIVRSSTRKQVMTPHGPQMVEESTFMRPLSLMGFTLLLAHPKREFSLEIHGPHSLRYLGLTPSATLTVMMCQERGVVRRGDLEGRLAGAQGDAMDVEGLSYEGLLELTERVGRSNRWDEKSQARLEANSHLISPVRYLECLNSQASNQETSEKDRRCPICLGDFDATDDSPTLRQLHLCSHVFHVACLDTWLQTKPACPMCNETIA